MGGEGMAAAELSGAEASADAAEGSVGRRAALRAWAVCWGGLWAVTLVAAGLIAAGGQASTEALRSVLALSFHHERASVAELLGLWAHNTPIAAWPLLLTPLGAHRRRLARYVADLLVAACAIGNALPVGAALGAYGVRLAMWLPHLPLEWAGLACGPAWWLLARQQPLSGRVASLWLAACCGLMLAAAGLETFIAGRL